MNNKIVFSKIFHNLRKSKNISQEEAAELFGVSRQAVQKWESGNSVPGADMIVAIAKTFNISLDYLMCGEDKRSTEKMRTDGAAVPAFCDQHPWESYYKQLPIEYRQTIEEGKDIESYEPLLAAVHAMPDCKYKADMGDIIYNFLDSMPLRKDYPYIEPSDFEDICAFWNNKKYKLKKPTEKKLEDKLAGAWYGRICGCLLGKPVEGIKRKEFLPFLKASRNFPMHRYIVQSDLEKAKNLTISFPLSDRVYHDGILDGMPTDDDTNYIVLDYLLVLKYGKEFTPNNVAEHWLWNQPKDAFCTAERVAYKNFVNGYHPPESARYKNPYREWIGAQIRGDFFGWINPGNPAKAAEMAWKDACISHVKNGIYGEMWIASMLAAVGGGASIKDSIEIGLDFIPAKSRLYEAIKNVVECYNSGKTSKDFFADFHKRWDDNDGHHWCHTISNAEIVAASLLWGEGDYGKSICLAVEQAFDTDCNGATVGSVVGLAVGKSGIPDVWTDKISGTLFTTIFGNETVNINEMVKKTMELI